MQALVLILIAFMYSVGAFASSRHPCDLALAPTPYETVEMREKYRGEEARPWWGWPVRYLSERERAASRVTVRDGLFLDQRGGRLSGWFLGQVVMDGDGEIYANLFKVFSWSSIFPFHHSSFLSGGSVAAAGEALFENGRMIGFWDRSGHYTPGPRHVVQLLSEIYRRGADLPPTVVLTAYSFVDPQQISRSGELVLRVDAERRGLSIKVDEENVAEFSDWEAAQAAYPNHFKPGFEDVWKLMNAAQATTRP